MFGSIKTLTEAELAKIKADFEDILDRSAKLAEGGDGKLYNLVCSGGTSFTVKLTQSLDDFREAWKDGAFVTVLAHGAAGGREIFVPAEINGVFIMAIGDAPVAPSSEDDDPRPLFHEDGDGNLVHTESGQIVGAGQGDASSVTVSDTKLN